MRYRLALLAEGRRYKSKTSALAFIMRRQAGNYFIEEVADMFYMHTPGKVNLQEIAVYLKQTQPFQPQGRRQ